MGETCSKNYDRAIDLLESRDTGTLRQRLREYGEKVKMLNSRTELPVTRDDVVECMRFHATRNEEFLTMIDDLEIIGQAFYNTAIHFKTLRALICNPGEYATKINMANGHDKELKSDPSVKNIKELFIKEAVTVRTPGLSPKRKRNHKQILRDVEERNEDSTESSSSLSSDDDDDEDNAAVSAASSGRKAGTKSSITKKRKIVQVPQLSDTETDSDNFAALPSANQAVLLLRN